MLLPQTTLRERLTARMREKKAAAVEAAAQRAKKPKPDFEALDRQAVKDELRAVDQHRKALKAKLAGASKSTSAVRSFEEQELRRELDELAHLRAELAHDADHPITHNREGASLTDRERAYRRARTREIAAQNWHEAERAAAAGDHRRARRKRHDALRARHLAEREMNLRPSLRGFDFPG
ncbi:hypothetical protein [Methyloligella solikamskensis]|uniref:Uncharacterized protein n=1 Tax=Methyloligella solikamskensis TaxID=1177756 RepID=A0ABW3JD95_9HYPH